MFNILITMEGISLNFNIPEREAGKRRFVTSIARTITAAMILLKSVDRDTGNAHIQHKDKERIPAYVQDVYQ